MGAIPSMKLSCAADRRNSGISFLLSAAACHLKGLHKILDPVQELMDGGNPFFLTFYRGLIHTTGRKGGNKEGVQLIQKQIERQGILSEKRCWRSLWSWSKISETDCSSLTSIAGGFSLRSPTFCQLLCRRSGEKSSSIFLGMALPPLTILIY